MEVVSVYDIYNFNLNFRFLVLTTELTGMGTPMREAIRVAMSACRREYDSIKIYLLYYIYSIRQICLVLLKC